jgi:hypothetical protein
MREPRCHEADNGTSVGLASVRQLIVDSDDQVPNPSQLDLLTRPSAATS